MVTMVLPPSLVRNHAKHDEDMGGIGEKNIGGQLGLARIYSTQWPIKKHDNSLQNSPFWKQAHPSAAFRIVVY
jgi:hypothetical protein